MKKLWFKADPAITAEVFPGSQLGEQCAARIDNPRAPEDEPRETIGIIDLPRWSDVELIPTPQCAPGTLWTVVHGEENPTSLEFQVFTDEVSFRVYLQTASKRIVGYYESAPPPTLLPVELES